MTFHASVTEKESTQDVVNKGSETDASEENTVFEACLFLNESINVRNSQSVERTNYSDHASSGISMLLPSSTSRLPCKHHGSASA